MAGSEQRDKAIEHRLVLILGTILQNETEGAGDLVHEARGLADHDVHTIGQAGALDVRPCDRRAIRIPLTVNSSRSGASARASRMAE